MVELRTPVGRIVWGHPTKGQIKKDPQTRQPKLNKEGKPTEQWAFGLAIEKAAFQQHVWPFMAQEAATGYPNGVPNRFSWKYHDGDGVDSNGKPFSAREGYAGCYVLNISSEAFSPPAFKYENGQYVQMSPEQIKTGDYIAVALNLKVNVVPQGSTNTPSLYVNPVAIDFVGYGKEIQTQADPNALFGGQQYQLPPGASQTPISSAPHGVMMPGTGGGAPGYAPPPGGPISSGPQPGYPPQTPGMMPGQPPAPVYQQPGYPPQQPPGYGAPPVMPAPGTPPGYPPAHDFVHNAGYQQPPGYGAPPVMPAPGTPPGYPQPGTPPGYPQPGTPPGYPQPGMLPNR
jgi:hypothetical protein